MECKVNSGAKLRGKMAAKGGGRGGDEGRSDDVIMLFVHVKCGRGREERCFFELDRAWMLDLPGSAAWTAARYSVVDCRSCLGS
jgi:hypothetical protein